MPSIGHIDPRFHHCHLRILRAVYTIAFRFRWGYGLPAEFRMPSNGMLAVKRQLRRNTVISVSPRLAHAKYGISVTSVG
jgi:hypothetical protein